MPTLGDETTLQRYEREVQLEARIEARMIAAEEMLRALKTTAGNLRSLAAACNCTTYNEWLHVVESAIAKAEGL